MRRPVDPYGLTAADWCRLLPDDLFRKASGGEFLDASIAAGVRAGDPKALFLQAMATIRRFPGLQGTMTTDVAFDLDRAAATGLAIAAILWDDLARRNILLPRPEMLEDAARGGHVLSQALVAARQVEAGDADAGVAALQSLLTRDQTGFAAYLLSRVYAGNVSPQAQVDLARSVDLTREAARKGYLPAIDLLLGLRDNGTVVLAPAETDALMQRLREAGREAGDWWAYDRLRARGTPDDDRAALALLRDMMVKFPKGDAALEFARLATRALPGEVPPDDVARAVDQAVGAQNPEARTLRGELRMGLITGADDLPLLPIDPAGALADLKAALDLSGDPRARLLLARYYLLGVGGAPDPQAAEPYLRAALNDPDGASSQVSNLQAAVDRAAALARSRSAADFALGEATAPVSVTVLFDPGCPGCDGTDTAGLADLLRWLRATYVQAGFVRLDLRPVTDGASLSPAHLGLGCPDSTAEAKFDRLFGDPPAAGPDDAACIARPDLDAMARSNSDRLKLLGSPAFARDGAMAPADLPEIAGGSAAATPPGQLPAMVINGWRLQRIDRAALETTIYLLLAPAQRLRLVAVGRRSCQDAALAAVAEGLLAKPDPGPGQPSGQVVDLPAERARPTGAEPGQGIICPAP